MSMAVVAKALLLFAFVLVGLAPLVSRLARLQRRRLPSPGPSDRAGIAEIATVGWLWAAADGSSESPWQVGDQRSRGLAPLLASLPVLLVIAVIPFAGAYVVGETPVALVIADLDWGLLYVMALLILGTYAPVVAGFTSDDPGALLRAFRSAAQTLSYTIALGFSAAGVFMIYASLQLPEIAASQDANFQPFAFVEMLGWGTLPAWLAWVRLPYWGIFLQPLGGLLFFTCLLAATKSPPFDAARVSDRFASLRIVGLVREVVTASLVTTLFLGGFTIPFASQVTLLSALGPSWGHDGAVAICMALQVACFTAKAMVLVWLQLRMRWSLARFPYPRVMDLCWKIVVPLAFANLVATAFAMRWIGAAP